MDISQIAKVCGALAKSDLTASRVLILTKCLNGTSMTEISREVGHSTAAATGAVDYLERLSMVARQHDPNDRRKVTVTTTSKGKLALERLMNLINGQKA